MKNKINFTQIKKLVIKFLDQLFRWLGTDSLLENTKKRIIKFLPTNKIKVQWPKLVILFLFSLVLISLGTFFYQSFCDDVWQGTSLTANIVKYIKNKDVPSHYIRRQLDGVYVEPDLANFYPVAVIIDNDPVARSQAGLAQAQLVYEAKVESGITRYLAIFSSGEELENIGPVRSVRPYFLDWLEGLDGLIVHVGGSPQALARIINKQIFNLNEFYQGKYFWRSNKKIAPHNVYISTAKIQEYLTKLNIDKTKFASWNYKEDAPKRERPAEQEITIDFSVPDFKVQWIYNKADNNYRRHQAGEVYQESNGDYVDAKNIIMMQVASKTIDSELRRELTTIGSGSATYCFDGKCETGTWKKESVTTREKIYNNDNQEVNFNAGTTWIEVVQFRSEINLTP